MGRTFKTTVVFCCFESKLHCYSANHESFFFKKGGSGFQQRKQFLYTFQARWEKKSLHCLSAHVPHYPPLNILCFRLILVSQFKNDSFTLRISMIE